jgi:hypothetical protein
MYNTGEVNPHFPQDSSPVLDNPETIPEVGQTFCLILIQMINAGSHRYGHIF